MFVKIYGYPIANKLFFYFDVIKPNKPLNTVTVTLIIHLFPYYFSQLCNLVLNVVGAVLIFHPKKLRKQLTPFSTLHIKEHTYLNNMRFPFQAPKWV